MNVFVHVYVIYYAIHTQGTYETTPEPIELSPNATCKSHSLASLVGSVCVTFAVLFPPPLSLSPQYCVTVLTSPCAPPSCPVGSTRTPTSTLSSTRTTAAPATSSRSRATSLRTRTTCGPSGDLLVPQLLPSDPIPVQYGIKT